MSRNKVFWAAQARRDMNLDLQTETMVDLRVSETLQTGAVRKPPLLFSRLVCTVPTVPMRCGPINRDQGWKPHLPFSCLVGDVERKE